MVGVGRGRYCTVKRGDHAGRDFATACCYFDRRFHLAALLSRLIPTAMRCDPSP
jgi:hypothetical protein